MTFRNFAVISLLASLLVNSAHAENPVMWEDFEGFNEGNDKTIEDCIAKSPDVYNCKTLKLPFEGANWSAGAYQSAAAWSAVGKKFYETALKKHPNQASLITDSQIAWYDYSNKECDMEAKTATYEDDDSDGNHPSFYDSVAYNSCLYGLTMDRTLTLYSQTK